MRRSLIHCWAQRSVLGLVLLAGCSHTPPLHLACAKPASTWNSVASKGATMMRDGLVVRRTSRQRVAAATTARRDKGVQPVSHEAADSGIQSADHELAGSENSVMPAYCPAGKRDTTTVNQAYCPPGASNGAVSQTEEALALVQLTSDSSAPPVVMPEEHGNPLLARGPATPGRCSYVDLTADSCFSHADDYSWLQGQVEFSRICKGWRLRYASVDESDRYGGSVTLAGDGDLRNLKDGQYVRAKGHLLNPTDRAIAPAYRVDSFDVIGKSK